MVPLYKHRKFFVLSPSTMLLFACASDSEIADTVLESTASPSSANLLSRENVVNASSNLEYSSNRELKLLFPVTDPYWVKSLEMDDFQFLEKTQSANGSNVVYYTFPKTLPIYVDKALDQRGWEPVGDAVEEAAQSIFSNISQIIDINFQFTEDAQQLNVISIMSNKQGNTDAYAYFPSREHFIGSDIFVANDHTNPKQLTHSKTNYDYEIIVHEIGHALGLKHPFGTLEVNTYTLPSYEDTSHLTAMTYSEDAQFFDGDFRPFDYLTLVQVYGINPKHNAGNDIYEFSSREGVYIIDSGGVDTIDAKETKLDAVIDLRENSHSFLGEKHQYISVSNQLTISMHSMIENVVTGSGNDHIMGNSLDNYIRTNLGDDLIFPSEGRDIIEPGPGFNQIDLFEETEENDFILFNMSNMAQYTQIHNFQVIGLCDVLVIDGNFKGKSVLSEAQKVYSDSINFENYDIYRFSELVAEDLQNIQRKLDLGSSDKLLLSETNSSGNLTAQLYAYNAKNDSESTIDLIANIDTLDIGLDSWSPLNFMIV